MNTRIKYSIVLLSLGLILAFLPLSSYRSFSAKPQRLLSAVVNDTSFFTVDQVAKFILNEDFIITMTEEILKVTNLFNK